MKSHEKLAQFFEAHPAKALCRSAAEADDDCLDLSYSMLNQWTKPIEDGGKPNPLDRIYELTKLTGDPQLVEWLCEKADGIFLRNPDMNSDKRPYLGAATTEGIKLLTQMIQILVEAYEDHQITAQEASQIREKWERLKLQIEGYVVCCERRLFKDLQATVAKTKPGRSITEARETTSLQPL